MVGIRLSAVPLRVLWGAREKIIFGREGLFEVFKFRDQNTVP